MVGSGMAVKEKTASPADENN